MVEIISLEYTKNIDFFHVCIDSEFFLFEADKKQKEEKRKNKEFRKKLKKFNESSGTDFV